MKQKKTRLRELVSVAGLALAVAASAGCSGGGGGGGDVAVSEIGQESAKAQCAHLFSCCSAEELMEELGFFMVQTEPECVQVLGGFAQSFLGEPLQAGIDSGRIVYHGDRMRDCIDTLNAMSCSERAVAMNGGGFAIDGCDDPFEGQQANGEPCALDEECQTGYCDGDMTDFEGNTTEGVCADVPQVGSDCSESFECGPDARCDFSNGQPTCSERLAAGAECGSDDDCESGNCEGAGNGGSGGGGTGTCSADPVCDGA